LVYIDESCDAIAEICAETPPSPPFTAGFGEGAAEFDAFLHFSSRHLCLREQGFPVLLKTAHSKGAAGGAAAGAAGLADVEAAEGADEGAAVGILRSNETLIVTLHIIINNLNFKPINFFL
jgi:hypothetical protein